MECHPICPRKTKRKSNWNSTLCTILMRWRTTTTTKTIHITHICMLKLMHHTHMHSTYKNQSNRIIFLLLTQILWWFWMNWWFLLPMASFSFFFSCFFFFWFCTKKCNQFWMTWQLLHWYAVRSEMQLNFPHNDAIEWNLCGSKLRNGITFIRTCSLMKNVYDIYYSQ